MPLSRHTVSAALKSAGVAPDCLAEVELALSEACTNVYRHAGNDDSYEVLINVGEARLTIDVVDIGAGFGPTPTTPSPMPGGEAEGGRGLALMRALTEQALFDTVADRGTSVHLVKQLRWITSGPRLSGLDVTSEGRG